MRKSLVLIVILMLFIISACTSTKKLETFYTEVGIKHINEISIQNEEADTSIKITDQNKIDEFVSLIKDIEFTQPKEPIDDMDLTYKITFWDYDNEKEFEFLLNKIGDTYYEATSNIFRIVDQYFLKELEEN